MKIIQSILLLTLLICLTKVSQAQEKKFVLSAPLQYTVDNYGDEYSPLTKARNFLINPQLMYRINKHWALGPIVSIGISKQSYDMKNYNNYIPSNTSYGQKATTIKYGLSMQRYLYDNGTIQLFTEINGLFGNYKSKMVDVPDGISFSSNSQKYNSFEAGLNLGGRYQFTKTLGIEARINHLVSYNKKSNKEDDYKNSQFNLISNVFNSASVGIAFNF
ncbi:outer membrane beta-barrel protein [Sphingobacterium faecium]|uniref:outer membrane beta-barrel protein n=1 Tax=Sphingobacterium faecium TaxID=34087 RepID=UPI0032078AA4